MAQDSPSLRATKGHQGRWHQLSVSFDRPRVQDPRPCTFKAAPDASFPPYAFSLGCETSGKAATGCEAAGKAIVAGDAPRARNARRSPCHCSFKAKPTYSGYRKPRKVRRNKPTTGTLV